jgi:hypothetical protein
MAVEALAPSAGLIRRAVAPAAPLGRIAVFRVVIYTFVVADLFLFVNDVIPHAAGDDDLYRPLLLRRVLELPAPSLPYAEALRVVLVVGCGLLAWGRLPRPAGTVVGLAVALAFTDWVSIGMSYSKVDHDHLALVVALWVLPTVGRSRFRDVTRSEAAGLALLCVQVAVVSCYFLSAWAKVRFGGWDWVTGATFTWAVIRRGTPLGRLLLDPPWLLVAGQFALFTLEAAAPLLLFLRGRWLYLLVGVYVAFHAVTFAGITIHFLPHAICLTAFLPVERLVRGRRQAVTSGVRTPEVTAS